MAALKETLVMVSNQRPKGRIEITPQSFEFSVKTIFFHQTVAG